MEPKDYKDRTYLSAIEAAKFLGISVEMLHNLANRQAVKAKISASGQLRFDLKELKRYEQTLQHKPQKKVIGACCVKGFPKAGSRATLALADGFVQQALMPYLNSALQEFSYTQNTV